MLRRKAFKFRLKTDSEIEASFAQMAGCNRLVWNKTLALQKERLGNKEYTLHYVETAKHLKAWKDDPDTDFLKSCHSQTMQQTLKDLDRALKDAFSKKSPKRFPNFKKKGHKDSFRYPQGVKIENRRIFLPKIGWVGFWKSRNIPGIIKNTTVSRQGKHWFVAIQTEYSVTKPKHPSKSIIGIDLGVKQFATLSNGEVIKPESNLKKHSKNLAAAQKSLAKKVKRSSNFNKQKEKVNKIYTKVRNARLDHLHKVSTKISKNHAVVVLENLKVKNMSRSAKGTKEKPGKCVKAKSGLNRSILDQGWGIFKQLLEYKLQWLGGELILIDPKYTSQRCTKCNHVSSNNRASQSSFCCMACGHTDHADANAADNILAAGHAVLACGEFGLPNLVKQELLVASNSVPACA
ncbi:transposase [Sulfobacillus acidophilus]|uniref:Transposase n=1 Tax=Sulfobacillus acidophilus TaxID=53633 RepID=A0ABS3AVC2_9FIRM|nr:transposase [Sulfobacillus acidophilus]